MAQRVYIPFTDSNPDCLIRYIVEYKAPTDVGFNRAPDVFASPAVVDGLTLGVNYTFKITKECCDGTIGNPTITNYTPVNGLPVFLRFINNATTGPTDAIWGIAMIVDSPSQIPYSGNATFTKGVPNNVVGTPLDPSTDMPLVLNPLFFSNLIGNGVDYDILIEVTDAQGNALSGTDFPLSGTVLSNQSINQNGVVCGTSTNGYIFTFTISDAT